MRSFTANNIPDSFASVDITEQVSARNGPPPPYTPPPAYTTRPSTPSSDRTSETFSVTASSQWRESSASTLAASFAPSEAVVAPSRLRGDDPYPPIIYWRRPRKDVVILLLIVVAVIAVSVPIGIYSEKFYPPDQSTTIGEGEVPDNETQGGF